MMLKNYVHIAAVMLLCALACDKSAIAQGKKSAKRPNIVYVLVDEWRAQATGYAGDPNVKTPNLDKLAGESTNFTNAVSVLPVCTPHRAALLTGRYPQHTGMFMNDLYLPDKELCMGEIYKSAGYNTAYVGKWHVDGHGRQTYIPKERRQGFDYWHANECSHSYNRSKYFADEDTTMRIWKGYDAYAETNDAAGYIKTHAGGQKPFILVIGYGVPHYPHAQAPEDMKRRYDPAKMVLRPNVPAELEAEVRKEMVGYYAHCTALDSCIGMLRKTITDAGIDNNTIFVFTSDHGEMMGSHGVRPETKQRPWDESIRVPFLIRYPAKAAKSKQVVAPINTPDILPTLLGLCDVAKPNTLEGDDLSGLITGKQTIADRAALVMNISPFSENVKGKEYRGIHTARYTYIRSLEGPWLLFDNESDPYQLNNLANKTSAKAIQETLDKTLWQKLTALGDEFKPREYYLQKWGLKVNNKLGEIPWGPGPYPAQSPVLQTEK